MATTISSISFKDSSTWYSLLNLIYPVGALYGSTSSTSPANLFGGSWSQIKGAVLAATGANGYAAAAKAGGSLKMSTNQMPSHNHTITTSGDSVIWTAIGHSNASSGGYWYVVNDWGNGLSITNTGGGRISCPTTMQHIGGSELPDIFSKSECGVVI